MGDFNPCVSIIIPIYNGADYMCEAIDSAIKQTYENKEIIVVNDGSNDNGLTERIAKNYGNKIRYISKPNGGVSTALNCGILNMQGEYFSWLSHDDIYTPRKIEKSIEALADVENKKTIIYCNSIHIDKDSREIKSIHKRYSNKETKYYSWHDALLQLQQQGSMNGCAFLIHKSILEECGLFDEELRFNQDGFMWNKMFLKKHPLICIPDVCVKNRVHDKQLTQTGQALFRSDCEKMSVSLIPELIKASTKEKNCIVKYIEYNAKHANYSVVKKALNEGSEYVSICKKMKIYLLCAYGIIRPQIRKLYYKVSRGVKTS